MKCVSVSSVKLFHTLFQKEILYEIFHINEWYVVSILTLLTLQSVWQQYFININFISF